ncbi:hypothetical protein PI125_g14162 [Phytophthora idaei]|nr:hypothetical protein PI125_g14162 [Phytophthora idaei]
MTGTAAPVENGASPPKARLLKRLNASDGKRRQQWSQTWFPRDCAASGSGSVAAFLVVAEAEGCRDGGPELPIDGTTPYSNLIPRYAPKIHSILLEPLLSPSNAKSQLRFDA